MTSSSDRHVPPDEGHVRPGVTDQLRLAREQLAGNRYFPAIAAADAVLASDPGHAEALYLRAAAMARMGHIKATVAARAAVAAAPGDGRALLVLGQALVKEGDAGTAAAVTRQAVTQAPGDPDVLVEAGDLAEVTGDAAFARWAYEEALRLAPGHARARQGLGGIELAEGRLGRAASHFAEAASADPSHDGAAALREIARRLVVAGAGVATGVLVVLLIAGRTRRVAGDLGGGAAVDTWMRASAGVAGAALLAVTVVALVRVPARAWRLALTAIRQEPALAAGLVSIAGTTAALGWYAATGALYALIGVLACGILGWISRALLA